MAVTKVVMPKLSEAMESGKVLKWVKKEGDRVQGGDILAEVETDKAEVEMEAFGGGVLRKILVDAGNTAPVGSLIGVIADPDEDISAVVNAAGPGAGAPPATTLAAPAAGPPAAPASGAPQKPRVAERAPAPGPAAPPGGAPAPSAPEPSQPARSGAPAPVMARGGASPSDAPAAQAQAAPEPAPGQGERVKASPLAKKIASQSGVDLRVLHGSGPGGRIVRRDVEAAAAAPRPSIAPVPSVGGVPEAEAEYEDVALTPIRALIAKRMPLSKAPVPHFYVTTEVAMDRAWPLREQLNALEGQPKISVNDFIIRACAIALLQHPGVNASFQGESIRAYHRVHMGIAVALEDGLITPVLRDVHAKSLAQVAAEARDLAERARGRKLRAQEMSGATFSISNLGMFDVTEFSAIINPPEGAILAVGAVRRVPVVDDEGQVTAGRRMALTLSCDHRVMDGAMGARFLQDVRRLLEEPLRLLV